MRGITDRLRKILDQFNKTYAMTGNHRLILAGLVIFTVSVGCWDVVVYSVMIPLLHGFLGGGTATASSLVHGPLSRLISKIDFSGEMGTIIGALCVIGSMAARNILGALVLTYNSFVNVRLLTWLRSKIFSKYVRAKQSFLDDQKAGDLTQTLIVETRKVAASVIDFSRSVGGLVNVLVLIFLLVSISFDLTLVVVASGGLMGVVKYFYTKHLERLSDQSLHHNRAYSRILVEYASGLKQIKLLNLSEDLLKRSVGIGYQAEKKIQARKLFGAWEAPLVQVEGLIMIGAVFLIGYSGFLIGERIPLAKIIALLLVLERLIPVLSLFSTTTSMVLQAGPFVDYVYVFFMLEPEFLEDTEGIEKKPILKKSISFRGVNMDHKDRPGILKDIDLSIEKGSHIAIVGESGAGKSSLAHLLLRLYEPAGGAIYIDDSPLSDIAIRCVRDNIGLVSQDVHLFDLSIRDIIAMGKPVAAMDEIITAAKKANAHEFISELPQKYDTVVGERGAKLSGGQKQRLIIAQIILKDPEVVVFDEATSSLDSAAEREIMKMVDDLSKEKTLIMIAHRLSSLKQVDRIYVLDQGRIVESGSWDELVAGKGFFARMVEHQRLGNRLLEPKDNGTLFENASTAGNCWDENRTIDT